MLLNRDQTHAALRGITPKMKVKDIKKVKRDDGRQMLISYYGLAPTPSSEDSPGSGENAAVEVAETPENDSLGLDKEANEQDEQASGEAEEAGSAEMPLGGDDSSTESESELDSDSESDAGDGLGGLWCYN